MRCVGPLLVISSLVACGGHRSAVQPVRVVDRPPPSLPSPTEAPPAVPTPAPAPAAQVATVPCWDGTGPAIEGDATEVLSAPTMAKGYPGIVAVPDAQERARRATILAARNHGLTFTLGEAGEVTQISSQRMSCASQVALGAPRARGKVPGASPGDVALIEAIRAHNPDVLPEPSLSFTGFVQAADGTWQLKLVYQGTAAYHRLATTLHGNVMSDDRLLAAFARIAKIELVRVARGDSCGPRCGPPPVSTTVLGSRAITARDVQVQHYTAVYQTPRGLVIRKVAGLQLLKPDTRLSTGLTLIDAVTGEKVGSEPYDMFE